jgi:hypothetical protein
VKTLNRLWRIILHPRRVTGEILLEENIHSSLSVVLGFGLVLSLLFLYSYLQGDYPPPPEDLNTWIEAWGEFSMLPFVNIPPENYRLAQAIFMTPLVIAVWMLMAGSAKILSSLFGGIVSYEQYLNLFGFSFFVFWIIGSFLDVVYSGIFGTFVLEALRWDYGGSVRSFAVNFPPVMWTTLLSLGGIYNGIAVHEGEQFSIAKTALVALATFVWPIVLVSLLIR